ncbi:MAG: hypothetical protein H8D26_00255 [Methanomicrobia archaeon]|nr:hypothetical protein [Methanomicrobia archaeon]
MPKQIETTPKKREMNNKEMIHNILLILLAGLLLSATIGYVDAAFITYPGGNGEIYAEVQIINGTNLFYSTQYAN